ncbi:MAG: restriction endonuclease subunit S [Endomicrobium sp.]|nr:restriction endonuclease subunit S [Endomicrobium sp.]
MNLTKGYNYIATKDISFNNTIDYDNSIKIPFTEIGFKYGYAKDILLCIEGGSAGRKVAVVKEKICFGNKLCVLHPILINSLFLYYFIQSKYFLNLFGKNISGIIGGVSIKKLQTILIPLPTLQEQTKIVEKLNLIFKELQLVKN